jgi:hypothetical protein
MRAFGAVALVGVLLAACGGLFDSPDPQSVREAAEFYSDLVRWGRIDDASAYVHADHRAEFRSTLGDLQGALRITAVAVEDVSLGPETDRALVTVRFRVYRLPSVAETTLVDRQEWRYESRVGRWQVMPDLALYRGETRSGSFR